MRRIVRWLAPTAASLCALAAASAAHAASTKEIKEARAAGASYLRSQQLASGGFPEFGREWVLSAFAADGTADANVRLNSGSTDARTYYRELVGDAATWPGSEPSVGDFESAALAAYAAGIDPARVSASQNLIAQIIARYQPEDPGYYGEPGFFNETVFALIALADTPTTKGAERVPRALLEESVGVLRRNQHTDGGWSYAKAEGSKEALEEPGEAEMTGAAMAALCGAGVRASDEAVVAARHFLADQLAAEPAGSGSFETGYGLNTDSNAWAVEGLNACGISVQESEFTSAKGKTPIDFLISQQLSGGGFRFEPEETTADFYSSQDAVRALAGAGFTATPPTAKGAPRWLYEKHFTPTVHSLLSVIVNAGGSTVTPCAVTVAPEAKTATLAAVLQAAETAATPAGCVTSFTPSSGSGAITSIDGLPAPPSAKWKISIDGGGEKTAKRNTSIGIGDTIYLRLG